MLQETHSKYRRMTKRVMSSFETTFLVPRVLRRHACALHAKNNWTCPRSFSVLSLLPLLLLSAPFNSLSLSLFFYPFPTVSFSPPFSPFFCPFFPFSFFSLFLTFLPHFFTFPTFFICPSFFVDLFFFLFLSLLLCSFFFLIELPNLVPPRHIDDCCAIHFLH